MKRCAALCVVVLAASVVGAAASAAAPALPPPPPVAPPAQAVAVDAAKGWAVQVLVDSSRVSVRVPDAYAQTPDAVAAFARWGSFLGTLLHGVELDGVTLAFGSPQDVQRMCSRDSLACYDPRARTIYAPTVPPDGWALEQVIAHEYGHHVAASRDNSPWQAFTWGTKRWATLVGVCGKVLSAAADPFGGNWFADPGEAFAETYRVLNARRAGVWGPAPVWSMGPQFRLTAATLRAVELDVTQPWSPTLAATVKVSVRNGSGHAVVPAPLDGTVRVRLRGAARGAYVRVPGSDDPSAAASPVVDATVCGRRTLAVEVVGARAATVRLDVLA